MAGKKLAQRIMWPSRYFWLREQTFYLPTYTEVYTSAHQGIALYVHHNIWWGSTACVYLHTQHTVTFWKKLKQVLHGKTCILNACVQKLVTVSHWHNASRWVSHNSQGFYAEVSCDNYYFIELSGLFLCLLFFSWIWLNSIQSSIREQRSSIKGADETSGCQQRIFRLSISCAH